MRYNADIYLEGLDKTANTSGVSGVLGGESNRILLECVSTARLTTLSLLVPCVIFTGTEEMAVGSHSYMLYHNPVEDDLGKPQASPERPNTLT